MEINVEFGGGAELLFDNKKVHDVLLPHKEKEWILGDLLVWLKDNLLKERPELFLQDESVRPGILVLDTVNYVIKPNDRIIFISTLHGG
ncbi:hypothetical protein NQ314_005666 [Rhamnusium bicolor]|uniref:Ubiquitin-related modifier 1 homolog n=1 Tax=Rhamnusium bicolor TaxID=1586634 RepID=A0AAV8ZFA4_9CUCU|nr:hypothetical protein NQ314_005666 [Rhamnusium bicolor]